LPVAREGLPFIGIGCAVTILCAYLGLSIAAILTGILSLFTVYFFRDPERFVQADETTILTPADGKIIDIKVLENEENPLGESAIKLSIFMSLFNVHVNRVPVSGKIAKIEYHPGNFFSANLDKASEQNEKNQITLQTDEGQKIIFVQIAGLVARRIACWIEEGDWVRSGQRCGLIRFGSRLDVYVPQNSRIVSKRNQKVKAGETVLGYLS
jgi:phosphatidylserine decarboxylase